MDTYKQDQEYSNNNNNQSEYNCQQYQSIQNKQPDILDIGHLFQISGKTTN